MASYINVFLKTEITFIPRLLDKCLGKYYNNALCNGATWMFALWYILHTTFDGFLNALLKKMKYMEYMRIRLKRSLWYLGFYGCALMYCCAVFYQNNITFFTLKYTTHNTNAPSGHFILGFIVLTTFYLHTAFWERLKFKCRHNLQAAAYLCLFFQLCFLYFVRFIESSFRLTILISTAQIFVELARCSSLLISTSFDKNRFIPVFFLAISIILFIINYIIIIPIMLGYTLGQSLSPAIALVLSLQLIWVALETYTSVFRRILIHYFYHVHGIDENSCKLDFITCSLFGPRDDASYMLNSLLKEVKDREEATMKLRKPKNRTMVMQTLKCMVTIKRKLNERRKLNRNMDNQEEETVCDGSDQNCEDVVGGKLEFNIQRNKSSPKSKED